MTNHVRVIGMPTAENPLAKAWGRIHFMHIQYVNRMLHRSDRFFSHLECMPGRRVLSLPVGRPRGWCKKKYIHKERKYDTDCLL